MRLGLYSVYDSSAILFCKHLHRYAHKQSSEPSPIDKIHHCMPQLKVVCQVLVFI